MSDFVLGGVLGMTFKEAVRQVEGDRQMALSARAKKLVAETTKGNLKLGAGEIGVHETKFR